MKPVLNPAYGLYEKGGQAYCDSLQIAETFGKEHKNVLRDIESILENDEFSQLNFEPSSYRVRGKTYPCYLLTKDGFTLLVMGYSGKKALAFKKAYINRFNKMAFFIQSQKTAKLEFSALIKAITEAHEEPKHYHFSNEINMINKIVLGMDAKHYKQKNGLEKNIQSIRPYMDAVQMEAVEELQRIDVGLIVAGIDFNSRKQILMAVKEKRGLPTMLSA